MNAQQVWQSQSIEAPRMSLAYVRHITNEFDRRRRRRAALTYVLGVVCVWLSGFIAWQLASTKPLLAAATLYNALFVLSAIFRLYRHLNVEASPADAGVLDTLRYQRRQLERQRDWRRNSWRWAVLSLLPGWAMMLASQYFSDPVPWKGMAATVLVLVVAMGLSALHEERRARQSQREIDALDSLAGG